jgi:hypothetical protein
MQRVKYLTPILLVFLLIVGFYGWTAFSPHSGNKIDGVWSEYWYTRAPTGYEELADAFLHGRLSMTELPKPELLALPDPYDPIANGPFRHHDWVLYEGKYFLQWSPLPALLMFVPAKILGLPMNGPLACILLGSTLLILLFKLLSKTVPSSRSRSPIKNALLILLLGFGTYTPILLRRPAAYEVAILMGSTFAALSMLLFTKFQSSRKMQPLWASMSVLTSLLSFWSRPSFLFMPILTIGFIVFNSRNNLRKIFYAVSAPLISVATAMGSYNYLRFGSLSEFGSQYQLAGFKPDKFSTKWILPKLQSDFLSHRFFGFFPWTTTGDSPFNARMRPGYNIEQNLGLFVVIPWAFIVCIISWQKRHSLMNKLIGSYQIIAISLLIAVSTWTVQLLVVPGTTSRYLGDFAPFFILVILSMLLASENSNLSIKINFGNIFTIALLIFVFQNQLSSLIALGSLLALLFLHSRAIVVRVKTNYFLFLATIWTVGIIGLTSLTVQGFDQLNLLPPGFNWWEPR